MKIFDSKMLKYIFAIGLLLAIVTAFVPVDYALVMWVITVILGVILGLSTSFDVKTGLALIALVLIFGLPVFIGGIEAIPMIGVYLKSIFTSLTLLFGVILLTPAFKFVLKKFGLKI